MTGHPATKRSVPSARCVGTAGAVRQRWRGRCYRWRRGPSWRDKRRKGGAAMKRILVAYDGGERAQKALGAAMELARPFDAAISVVSVVPQRIGRSPTDPWDDREVHATELLEAKKMLVEAGFEAELIEPAGDPALSIERIADAGGGGTGGGGGWGLPGAKRLLVGPGCEADLIERAGDPALSIERIADAGGFDMVVVGSRGL